MDAMLVGNFMEKKGCFSVEGMAHDNYVLHVLAKKGWFLKVKFSMFCRKKGGKMQGKIHEMGLKLALTDEHGFQFYASAPHRGSPPSGSYGSTQVLMEMKHLF